MVKVVAVLTCFLPSSVDAADGAANAKMKEVVDKAISPIMREFNIPGMAVAITANGNRYFFNYGVASSKKKKPVSDRTLFEIGSVSKTFAASLASYSIVNGTLKLSSMASEYLPYLKGTAFDQVSVLNLATHTSGGLPLQVPEAVQDDKQLVDYLKNWKPAYAPGTHRIYSNPSIGVLGMIAAKSLDQSYEQAVEKNLFAKLGMTRSYLNVPADRQADYAEGHTQAGAPARLTERALWSEAYGVRTCAPDLIQYLEANMNMLKLDPKIQQALDATHHSYFKCGEMTQDLAWEQYPIPVKTKSILASSSDAIVFKPNVVTKIDSSSSQDANVLINKTGSTNGFSTFVVFIPSKKIGVAMLANKNIPIAPRVIAACQILAALDGDIITK